MTTHVHVIENVLKANDEVAQMNRADLRAAGVFSVDLLGGPGCGKTSLVEATCAALRGRVNIAVIVGDLTTQRDADRIAQMCPQVIQVNTGKGCHLEAHHVRQALTRLDLAGVNLLIIENVGNLVCPVGFDLGQDVKVSMFCTTEGADKPAKYPYAVLVADAIILNKVDLLAHVPFDRGQFYSDVRRLHANVPVLECSAFLRQIDPWVEWVGSRLPVANNGAR